METPLFVVPGVQSRHVMERTPMSMTARLSDVLGRYLGSAGSMNLGNSLGSANGETQVPGHLGVGQMTVANQGGRGFIGDDTVEGSKRGYRYRVQQSHRGAARLRGQLETVTTFDTISQETIRLIR
jgi:hypothetical protein